MEDFPLTRQGVRDLNKSFPMNPREFVIPLALEDHEQTMRIIKFEKSEYIKRKIDRV